MPTAVKPTSKPIGGVVKTRPKPAQRPATVAVTDQTQAAAVRSVKFADAKTTVEVPSDQLFPIDVWNVYSPVTYMSRKEQRKIQLQRETNATAIRGCCSTLFTLDGTTPVTPGAPGDNRLASVLSTKRTSAAGYGMKDSACASFIMSLWPGCVAARRPVLKPEVEQCMERLLDGTRICIFNEVADRPIYCMAALRLLRSVGGDEGSIAIYNYRDSTAIDGYVPIAFLRSLSYGLQPVEKRKHERDDGTIVCVTQDTNEVNILEARRCFTLHCEAPQRFYVSFVAFTDGEFATWKTVLEYFVQMNAACIKVDTL